MKYYLILLLFLSASTAHAQQVDVPVVSFSQQVDIVVSAKKDPRILDVKFRQEKDAILLDVVVDKSTDLEQGKKLALDLVMYAKAKSLDDQPKEKGKPGKGLYDYVIVMKKPDGVSVVTATKEKAKEDLTFEDPFQVDPLTRADEDGR